jgi:hypothetical protein
MSASAYVVILGNVVVGCSSDAFFSATGIRSASITIAASSDSTAAGNATYSAVELIDVQSDMSASAVIRVFPSASVAITSSMTANGRYLWEKETVAEESWTNQSSTPATWTPQSVSSETWTIQ